MPTSVVIKLTMAPGEWRRWRPLLWQGFRLEVEVGVSIEGLLIGELGINREFVENRVRTVFLNGCPVDELSTAIVEEGSQMALGGSMPGMVGIAMQRHSPAGFVRQEITYPKAKTHRERKRGSITVRLFNEMAEVLGPLVLRRGIGLEAEALKALWADPSGVLGVEMNGKATTLDEVRKQLGMFEEATAKGVLLEVQAVE
ncbi:hypothetical protein ACFL02_08850 [Planctomycetota bacterium]